MNENDDLLTFWKFSLMKNIYYSLVIKFGVNFQKGTKASQW